MDFTIRADFSQIRRCETSIAEMTILKNFSQIRQSEISSEDH